MDFNVIEDRMKKTIEHLDEEYAKIRAGRANPAILNDVKVDYYGTPTPINQVGSISVPDGNCIRLVFPELNEQRRKELVKDCKSIAEETKVAIRNIRRDGIDSAKASQKSNEITEDDLKSFEEKIQKITDKYVENVDNIFKLKEKDIMEI